MGPATCGMVWMSCLMVPTEPKGRHLSSWTRQHPPNCGISPMRWILRWMREIDKMLDEYQGGDFDIGIPLSAIKAPRWIRCSLS